MKSTRLWKSKLKLSKEDNIFEFFSEWKISIKKTKPGWGIKIKTPKQMLQRLPIALAEVKTGNRLKCLKTKLDKLFLVLSKTNH